MAYDAASPTPVASVINALLVPLLFVSLDKAKLKLNDLVRVRLGMFPRTMLDVPYHNPHVDFYEPHLVGLYYVNDSDGDTVVFNESFENVSLEQSVKYANEGKFTGARRDLTQERGGWYSSTASTTTRACTRSSILSGSWSPSISDRISSVSPESPHAFDPPS